MGRGFCVDYEGTPFLETSKTAAHPNRLNWRCEILLTRNREAITGRKILDLASHDGRFSYACLELGASHVTGVEGRQHLVQSANDNLIGLGCKPERFCFIEGDVFDYLHNAKPNGFDTVLCFGFFYHTVRQNELIAQVRRIQAQCFLLDTFIARGVFALSPPTFRATDEGAYPRRRSKLVSRSSAVSKLGRFIQATDILRRVVRYTSSGGQRERPCLVFTRESHIIEAATIDPLGLVASPTKAFIELVLESYGFTFRELRWNTNDIDNWTAIEDYRTQARVSYIAQRLY